ncbi:hypothetical protein EDB85DRAFT_404056 [Lactarius pseudohatsudake]|nr:hypothetical protein EDB85DRAFT_404056 [Lactarius pseudohatsudake]
MIRTRNRMFGIRGRGHRSDGSKLLSLIDSISFSIDGSHGSPFLFVVLDMAKTWPPKRKQWQPPKQPPVVQPGSGNSTLINPCQRLNLVAEYICNMPKKFGDILLDYPCDYKVGGTNSSPRLHSPAHRASGPSLQTPPSAPHV